jgi:hypothetical protein
MYSSKLFRINNQQQILGGMRMANVLKGIVGPIYSVIVFAILAASIPYSEHVLGAETNQVGQVSKNTKGTRYLNQVTNTVYEDQCGACHFAYQPELLPSGSWQKIVADLQHHFGEEVIVDPDAKKTIADYLLSSSAETSTAKLSVKIMKNLDGQTPLRITDLPYIRKKHDDVLPRILKKEVGVDSLSHCQACHLTAEDGDYDDDNVIIPKKDEAVKTPISNVAIPKKDEIVKPPAGNVTTPQRDQAVKPPVNNVFPPK